MYMWACRFHCPYICQGMLNLACRPSAHSGSSGDIRCMHTITESWANLYIQNFEYTMTMQGVGLVWTSSYIKVANQDLILKDQTVLKNFSASLMERLVEPNSVETGQAMPKYEFVCLNTQSRMNPALLPLFEQDYAGADRPNRRSLQTREGILQVISVHSAHCKCIITSLAGICYFVLCMCH